MKKDKKTKKNSVMKKLVPATGMLLVSAIMLTTSTYAWFTMSREVEVTGIKMTASVPEGYEVSLGKGMLSSTVLETNSSGTNATLVTAPDNNTGNDPDWTHSVAVCDYYDFGYLIPASSINGTDIWYTSDATSAGKSVEVDAIFAQADTGTPTKMTTYDKITSKAHDANYAEQHQKGYYIDIPVWFRSTTKTASNLGVKVKITSGRNDGSSETGTGDLYKAARVAILDANGAVNSVSGGANKVIADSTVYTDATALSAAYYNRYNATQCGGTVVASPQAVKAAGTLNGKNASGTTAATSITNAGDLYGQVTFLTQTTENAGTVSGDAVVALAAPTNGNNFSDAVEKTIRVWLEGEDVNCWDSNASQSFTVDLTFTKIGTFADVTAANQTPTPTPTP